MPFFFVSLFVLSNAFVSDVSAQVECAGGEIDSLYVFIPPNIDRANPSNLRVVSLPEKFRNQRLWFQFTKNDDSKLFPDQYLIPIDVDANGNGEILISAIDLNQSNNTEIEEFSVTLRGGPFLRQNNDGAYYEEYPLCFEPSQALSISGTGNVCLNLGDECTPGQDYLPCTNAAAGYCDSSQSPARWILPGLTDVILNEATCEYLPTPGASTCSRENGNLPFSCGEEVVLRANPTDFSVDPIEHTKCCANSDQCDLALGKEVDGPVEESAIYSVCASNLDVDSEAYDNCTSCYGIWTAIGCIDQDPKSMISKLITIGTGIVGGVFLLRVLAAAFMLTTSQGDVKKTSEAKDMITEAIVGVIVIIFSVTLIQFFGSDILKIPGFGS